MPVYCYTHRDKNDNVVDVIERMFGMRDEKPLVIHQDGTTYHRDIGYEQGGHKAVCGNWPLLSDAVGCHPDQIPEMKAAYARHGVNVDFTKDGQAILESRGHRRAVMQVAGVHDRDGGYGDTYHG